MNKKIDSIEEERKTNKSKYKKQLFDEFLQRENNNLAKKQNMQNMNIDIIVLGMKDKNEVKNYSIKMQKESINRLSQRKDITSKRITKELNMPVMN